jgi:hypothetical protein
MKRTREIGLPAAIAIMAAILLACGPKEDDRARYVAVGLDGGIYISMDAVSWDKADSGISSALSGVAWNGEEFVAVGDGGHYLRSEDGRSWTGHIYAGLTDIKDIAAQGSRFIAVGDGGSVFRSDDHGETLMHSNLWGMTEDFSGICWTGSQFCVVAMDGTVATSPNGTDWTRQSSISGSPMLVDAASGGGLVFAVNFGLVPCSVWSSSTAGVSWTQHATGYGDGLDYIADSGSVVALVGFKLSQVIGYAATADHGHLDTWSARWAAPDTEHCPQAVIWDGSRFIAAGQNGMILLSDGDGTSWTLGSVGVTDETLVGLACR